MFKREYCKHIEPVLFRELPTQEILISIIINYHYCYAAGKTPCCSPFHCLRCPKSSQTDHVYLHLASFHWLPIDS